MAGRKVLSREKREGELLEAAMKVFAEKGYRATTVSDILERTDAARGTFYHYFDSKKDVFMRLIGLYFEAFEGVLTESHRDLMRTFKSGGDYAATWRQSVVEILRYHCENPELTAVVYREAMGLDEHFMHKISELSGRVKKALGSEFGMLADSGLMVRCDIDVLTTIIAGAVINIILDYVLGAEPYDIEHLAEGLVQNQIRALSLVR